MNFIKTNTSIIFLFIVSISSIYAQETTSIVYNGNSYLLSSYFKDQPIEEFFITNPDRDIYNVYKKPIITSIHSDNYLATYEIIDNKLFIIDLKILIPDNSKKNTFQGKWISLFEQVFLSSEPKSIDWYSGLLLLPFDGILREDYYHNDPMNTDYFPLYNNYFILEIKNGKLVEYRKFNSNEFTTSRKRQFQEFQKTFSYQKELDNWLKLGEDIDLDRKSVDLMLENYVYDFTTTFLIN